jgi:hypothetical protein
MKLLTIIIVTILLQSTFLIAQVSVVEKPLLSVPLQFNENNLKLITIDFSNNKNLDLIYNVNEAEETKFYLEENRGNNEFYPAQLLLKIPIFEPEDTAKTAPNKHISQFAVIDFERDGDFDLLVLIENEEQSYLRLYLNEHNQFNQSKVVHTFNKKNFKFSDLQSISFNIQNDFILLKDVSNDLIIVLKVNSNESMLNVIGEYKNYYSSSINFIDYDYDYDYDIVLNFNESTQKIRIYNFDKSQLTLKEVGIDLLSKQDYVVHHTADLFGYSNTILALTPKNATKDVAFQPGYAIDFHHDLEKFTIIDTFYFKIQITENAADLSEIKLTGACLNNTNLCDLIEQVGNEIYFLKNKYLKRIAEGDKSIFELPTLVQLPDFFSNRPFSLFRTIDLNFGNHEIIIESKSENQLEYFLLTTE